MGGSGNSGGVHLNPSKEFTYLWFFVLDFWGLNFERFLASNIPYYTSEPDFIICCRILAS